MKILFVIFLFTSISVPCRSRPAEEESVVSVYKTEGGGASLDVYSQIASNLAEKVSQPFYRFFNINITTTTKRPFEHIELQENKTRDIEPLSVQALSKTDKKPEKITLFSSYLPVKLTNDNKEGLNTTNEIDDDFDDEFSLDDVEETMPRGPFVYFLELVGSILQLLWGGFLELFKPTTPSESS